MNLIKTPNTFRRELELYQDKYLNSHENLNEAATRVIVDHLLSDVLGYRELSEIKSEYPVLGGYADYLIEINERQLFIVEVKSLGTPLAFRHLRQAIYYALNAGVKVIILTNAKDIQVYKIDYTERLKIRHVLTANLLELDASQIDYLYRFSRESIL